MKNKLQNALFILGVVEQAMSLIRAGDFSSHLQSVMLALADEYKDEKMRKEILSRGYSAEKDAKMMPWVLHKKAYAPLAVLQEVITEMAKGEVPFEYKEILIEALYKAMSLKRSFYVNPELFKQMKQLYYSRIPEFTELEQLELERIFVLGAD